MAKRRSTSPPSAADKRMTQWRSCGLLALALIVVGGGLHVTMTLLRREPTQGKDHSHGPAARGGLIVSVGGGMDHYHVEALRERGSVLRLFTLGGEVDRVLEVESQVLTARVTREGDPEPSALQLMPAPLAHDPEGKTSQFFGKLPSGLRGQPLSVTVTDLNIAGKKFQMDFIWANRVMGDKTPAQVDDEENLYLTPEGKYTEADIKANGKQVASKRFQGMPADHDLKPKPGDKICPVTRIKVNPEFAWVVGGGTYEFCCPPCVDLFMRKAREQPEEVREPQTYRKKK